MSKLSDETRDYSFRAGSAIEADIGEVEHLLAESDDEFRSNEVSDADLRQSLRMALEAALNTPGTGYYVDVVAVFEGEVVYYSKGKYWKQTYEITSSDDGSVALSGDAAAVRSVTRYVDVAAESPENESGDSDGKSENSAESKANLEASPSDAEPATVLAKVKQLLGLTNKPQQPHTTKLERRSSSTSNSTDEKSAAKANETESNVETETEKQETEIMSQTAKTEKAPRDERIQKLIANEKVAYSDADAAWMNDLTDAAFDRIEAVAYEGVKTGAASETKPETKSAAGAAVQAKANDSGEAASASATTAAPAAPKVETKAEIVEPKSAEEYIASLSAPPQIKRIFERHLEQEKAQRKELVSSIRANKANVFSEDQLSAMDTDQLVAIAKLAKPDADYSGLGNHTAPPVRANAADEPVRMPGMSFKIGGAREQKSH